MHKLETYLVYNPGGRWQKVCENYGVDRFVNCGMCMEEMIGVLFIRLHKC